MATTAAAIKPDREGFLRRLEKGDSNEETTVEDFLQQSGISASSMDASSLQALRELLCSSNVQEEDNNRMDKIKNGAKDKESNLISRGGGVVVEGEQCIAPPRPPLPEIATNHRALLRHQPSDLTQIRYRRVEEDVNSDASIAGSEEAEVSNKMLLNQLQAQTALLVDLQTQMEDLKQTVAQLQQQHTPMATASTIHTTAPRQQQQQQQQPRGGVAAVDAPEPAAVASRTRRIVSIVRVFVAMQNRQVQIDGAMLFKLFFMFMVLSSSVSTPAWGKYKNYIGILVVVIGFLTHSGYMKFLHYFFIQENIAGRIWNGEDIQYPQEEIPARRDVVVAAAAAEPQQQEEQAPNQEQQQGGGGWRDTFFGGVIPDPNANDDNDQEDGPNHQPLAVRIAQDIVYLVGSFVLSILPMWKPEGVQRRVVVVVDQEDDEPQEENNPNPVVVPDQRDAMQPESDDEDSIYGEE